MINVGEEGRPNPAAIGNNFLNSLAKLSIQVKPDWIKLVVDELGF